MTQGEGMHSEVTEMLCSWQEGDEEAFVRLIEAVYHILHKMARGHLSGKPDQTISPTVLVNEVYLKLVHKKNLVFENRNQFLSLVSLIMREVVGLYFRSKNTQKRGGGKVIVAYEDQGVDNRKILALNDALTTLSEFEPRKALIVELHHYVGLPFREIGKALSISERTALRDWQAARAWLYGALKEEVHL